MIEIEHTLVAERPIDDVFALFNDMATLTRCVPQCKASRIVDEDHFEVDLQLRLGIIPLENTLHMTIVERQPPHRLVTEGVGMAGAGLAKAAKLADSQGETRIRITFDLASRGATTTQAHCQIRAEAAGSLKRVYEGIIRGQRAKLESSFVDNVRTVLACPVELVDVGFQSDAQASPTLPAG